jgi:preprotein translocase subunit YajC
MQQAAQPGFIETMIPFLVIIVLFYFLIFRPQGKRQKEHQNFVSSLKRGDEVITQSGLLGTIEGLTDQVVTLEIANGVRVKMLRSQISGSAKALTGAPKT